MSIRYTRGIIVKISSVNNVTKSFGYNRQLNNELVSRLNNYGDRNWASTLASLNEYCNSIEDQLIKTENDADKDKYSNYLDLFLSMKDTLVNFVTTTFEDLSFSDRECKGYYDEFIKNGSKKDDWRIDACEVLSGWCLPQDEYPKDSEKIPDGDLPFIQAEHSTSKGSLLEKFKPGKTSPKGFSDVAGMDKLKKYLQSSIIEMINNPEQAQADFEEYGKKMPRAVLLYGSPGCGKTYISEALSAEINAPMYMFSIGKAGSSYINQTSQNIKTAFDEAIEIAEKTDTPVLLFMDEIDSVGFDRNDNTWAEDIKQVSTLLQAMDKAQNSGVIVLGATNKYNLLDPAVKRRFTQKTFVDIPDAKARKALIVKSLTPLKKGQKLLADEKSLKVISEKLDGFSNDSVCKIAQAAALNALERDRADIDVIDFEKAIEETTEEKPDVQEYKAKPKKGQKKVLGFTPA